jgi:hypothetical protein
VLHVIERYRYVNHGTDHKKIEVIGEYPSDRFPAFPARSGPNSPSGELASTANLENRPLI